MASEQNRTRQVNEDGLTENEAKFALEYLVDLNKTKAYQRAFPNASYETAMANSSKIFKKPAVESAIQKEMNARAQRTLVTADRVVHELAKLAFANSKDYYDATGTPIPPSLLPHDLAAAVHEYDGEKQKLKLSDKRGALELLGKHLAMFTDKSKIEGDITHHTGVLVSPGSATIDDWQQKASTHQKDLKDSVTGTTDNS